MRRSLVAGLLLALFAAAGTWPARADAAVPAGEPTIVVRWNRTLLECIRRSRLGPPMVARAIGIAHTCGFDAWAMYHDVAVDTRSGGALRRPAGERTAANREKAISHAEYRALLDLFPAQAGFLRERMTSVGYDPDDASLDPSTPAGVGNACAAAVIALRHGDGSNQLGDRAPGAYADYTGYRPVNTPDTILDPNRWQPQRFCDGQGGFVTPGFVGAHWGNVRPFALTSPSELRPPPPARFPHGAYVAQANEILRLNAHLDDRQKMIAEYWADGPRTELPPGHFTLFAEFVSARDGHGLDEDVVMFFALGNAMLDAGIATWEAKVFYDSERPITAIRFLKAGKTVPATVPFEGRKVIRGEDWTPYQPCGFVTPPFAEYPSGHSAFSAAGAEILARATGSDAFGLSVTLPALSSRTEPGFAPASDVTLSWATFSEAADQAGLSRRLGGIHFEQGDLESRKLGRLVGARVWEKVQGHVSGTAAAPAARALVRPAPAAFALETVTPNPGRGARRIAYVLSREARVRLTVIDVRGRVVARLADGVQPTGRHEATWPGAAAPGVYFLALEGEGGVRETRRVAIVD